MENKFGPILVTGADTGIGRYLTEDLAKKGYLVYAGVYLESNVDELGNISNVQAIKLDVTKSDDIIKMKNWVIEQDKGLYGLVNNAGVGELWPLIESKMEYIQRVLDINLHGVIRVTNALIPFLIESKGRIITMGSLSGTIPTKMLGAYSISKFGVEAFDDVLFFEIKRFGVHVATIKPGNVQSGITKALIPIYESRKEEFEKSKYKKELSVIYKGFEDPAIVNRDMFDKPDRVIKAISHALFSEKPQAKYLVTTKEDTIASINWMFRVIAQLNQNHEFAIDNEIMHEMLNKQLNKFQ